jgi:NitT/TauT family transport system permease protein
VIISTVVLVLLWKVTALIVGKSIIIPSPEETFTALIRIISSEHFLMQVLNTMKRVIIGFLISFSSGLFFGILAGFIEPIFYLLKPLIL